MKPFDIISPIHDLLFGLQAAFFPTLTAIVLSPSLLIKWHALSKVFMVNLWIEFGHRVDQQAAEAKKKLLMSPENLPEGVVLDLGAGKRLAKFSLTLRGIIPLAGIGHGIKYLDRRRVKRYIALEPNILMHKYLRAAANDHGYSESDGSLIILSCGAEDSSCILSSLASAGVTNPHPVDTIISILTLCSVPNPRRTLHHLVRDVLKPGGVLLVYEHVLNPREDVRWWQKVWAPIWGIVFGGCRMDRDTDIILKSLELEGVGGNCNENAWSEWKTWEKEGESEECLFWHCTGRFVKK